MLKFLRKYSKWILVVGGSLLMIAWLVPAGMAEMGKGRMDPVFMTVDGHSVRQRAIGAAAFELEILKQFGVLPTDKPEHWYLLTRAAEEGGYMGGIADAAPITDMLARSMTEQFIYSKYAQYGQQVVQYMQQQEGPETYAQVSRDMPQRIAMLGARSGGGEDAINMVLARFAGVNRMEQAYTNAARYSGRRLITDMRSLLDSANVDYLFIPADAYTNDIAEPDDATLAAFYERFRNTPSIDAVVEDAEATPPGGEYGIGYLLPSRVKLVYLMLDRQTISDAVQPSELEVQKRFLARYPNGEIPALAQKTPEQAKEDIRQEVRNELTDKAMKTAQDAVRAEFAKTTSKLASEGDYKKLPEDWSQHLPDFAAAAAGVTQRLREANDLVVSPATVKTIDTWQTIRELGALPEIGQAFYAQAGRQVPFAMQAMKVREIAGVNELHLQVGLPAVDVLVDQQGNRFFYMITAAREQSSPASLDEVRDRVVNDYKKLKAYEQLSQQTEALAAAAASEGLAALLAQQQARLDAASPARTSLQIVDASIGRSGQARPGRDSRIDSKEFRDALMDKAEQMDPTKPGDATPVEQRTLAMALPRSLGVVVGVIKAFVPATHENYLTSQLAVPTGKVDLAQSLNMRAAQESLAENNPFTLESLTKRMNVVFSLAGDSGEPEEDGAKPKSQPSPLGM